MVEHKSMEYEGLGFDSSWGLRIFFCPMLTIRWKKKFLYVTSSYNIPRIIQQTGNENTQTYQVEVVILTEHQILETYLQGNA